MPVERTFVVTRISSTGLPALAVAGSDRDPEVKLRVEVCKPTRPRETFLILPEESSGPLSLLTLTWFSAVICALLSAVLPATSKDAELAFDVTSIPLKNTPPFSSGMVISLNRIEAMVSLTTDTCTSFGASKVPLPCSWSVRMRTRPAEATISSMVITTSSRSRGTTVPSDRRTASPLATISPSTRWISDA